MSWRIAQIESELHIRLGRLPGLRLDVTRTEATELFDSLAKALAFPVVAVPRVPWRFRLHDWWALLMWRLFRSRREIRAHRERNQRLIDGGGW